MEQDLFLYLGLTFILLLGGLFLKVRMSRLFKGFRKLKTESDLHRLQSRSRFVSWLFSAYNWWRSRKSQRSNPDSFMKACRSGDLERLKKLLERGLDVNVRRHRGGRTGLMLASQKNQFQIVQFLLESGADPNLVGGGSGKTALIRAAEQGNKEIVRELACHGADLNVRAKSNGRTALMKAAECGFLEITKFLVEKGADIHFMDRSGRTALMLALSPANKKSRDILELLIGAGANLNMVDDRGESPLDKARDFRLTDCEELLMIHGAVSGRHKAPSSYIANDEVEKRAYETLGCRAGDSDDRIRKTFHEMVKRYHPDSISGKDLPEDFIAFSNLRFVELHEAYKVIMSSRKKS